MKKYCDQDIIEFCKKTIGNSSTYSVSQTKDCVDITVENNYNIDISFIMLFKLCDFFDTKNVNICEFYQGDGRETCGWGEKKELTIKVKEEKE